MTEKDKIVLRKPLAPTGDSEDCKADYEKLLAEFEELGKLLVEGIDFISSSDGKDIVVSLEKYNERVGSYTQKRDVYNEKYAGQIETMEDVKANIKKIEADMHKISAVNHEYADLLLDLVDEERKFEEIQKVADEAFEYVAKHTLVDGTVLTDEELAEREKQRSEAK